MGSSPVTGPTPNKGFEAAGTQKLGLVIKQLTDMFGMFGPGSDQGKDILKALNILAKHVPPGSVTPGAERNSLEQMMLKNAQQTQAMQALKPGAGAPPPGGAPGGAPPPRMPKAA